MHDYLGQVHPTAPLRKGHHRGVADHMHTPSPLLVPQRINTRSSRSTDARVLLMIYQKPKDRQVKGVDRATVTIYQHNLADYHINKNPVGQVLSTLYLPT